MDAELWYILKKLHIYSRFHMIIIRYIWYIVHLFLHVDISMCSHYIYNKAQSLVVILKAILRS